jgi:hypothetical protein
MLNEKKTTNSKPIPHIPLPFEELMRDALKVTPPGKESRKPKSSPRASNGYDSGS